VQLLIFSLNLLPNPPLLLPPRRPCLQPGERTERSVPRIPNVPQTTASLLPTASTAGMSRPEPRSVVREPGDAPLMEESNMSRLVPIMPGSIPEDVIRGAKLLPFWGPPVPPNQFVPKEKLSVPPPIPINCKPVRATALPGVDKIVHTDVMTEGLRARHNAVLGISLKIHPWLKVISGIN
jgi:hypothetical protein